MSSDSSRSWTASPNLRWSSSTRSSRSRPRPARSSMNGRHRSTSFLAAGGGAWPVSRSRTIMATASSIGASARSVTSSNLPRWKRSSIMAVRLLFTPSMRREPIASTRACSTASNTARACWPPGTSRRCTAGSWQASFSATASALPRTIAASGAGQLARRLGQPHLAADQTGPLGGERNLELGLLGDGAQAAGDRPLERLGRGFLALRLGLAVGRHRCSACCPLRACEAGLDSASALEAHGRSGQASAHGKKR